MKTIYIILSILCVMVLLYHIVITFRDKEGLTNEHTKSCESDTTTLIYKNAGTIQALQDKVQQLMKQVNSIIINDDKQMAEIQKIQSLETKYDSLAEKADEIASDNKQRLLAMAKQSKEKMDYAQKKSNTIKFSS